ncbi:MULTISPECIES: tail fiber assembly protein [Enterobacterales]|uniref:tail fiber assembly protein n=1 Tax=Enterobacterales TaxID=91347 RepID=UPI0011A1DEAC|nr:MULTISPECIES: tail fiber assembly protein [Enterobacterales]QLS34086.1 tail fiber assembly protein [Citrobacter sp. RHBSTW-00903]
MNKFYQGVFYPEALKEAYISAGTWPEHAADVNDEVMAVYSQYPPEGKMLGTDNNGYPVWVDIPALSPEERAAQVEQTRQELRVQADSEIAWRQYAVDRGKATAEEAADLIKWQDYRLDLMRIDILNPVWPTPPEV